MTSPYSPARIGDRTENKSNIKDLYKREAQQVSEYLKTSHHARKLAHMQVNYPDTCNNLTNNRSRDFFDKSVPTSKVESKYHNIEVDKYRQNIKILQSNISQEHDINHRKRMHNRLSATKSVAYDIVKGRTPVPEQEYIFPQKASHQQILAMTNTLNMSNPHLIPPPIVVKKKWLGDEQGWSS